MRIFACIRRKTVILSQSNIICPHGQAVQDVALSRRKLGFDSLWGYQTKKHLSQMFFLFKQQVWESNGRIGKQSCELYARPGVIAQTY